MSFERLAPHYTWMEAVLAGPRLQRCRTTWLGTLAGANEILIAGVGHGHFLRAAAERFPNARITSVDASVGMLRRAERRARASVGATDRLRFVQATLPDWPAAPETFDAIVTHFFLDCFPADELRAVVAGLARAGRPRCTWLLSDFTVPPRGWSRRRALAVHGLMYAFFRRVARVRARAVTDPEPFLHAQGFELRQRQTSEWGLLHADHWVRTDRA